MSLRARSSLLKLTVGFLQHKRLSALVLASLSLVTLLPTSAPAARSPVEGYLQFDSKKDYATTEVPLRFESGDAVELISFFSYGVPAGLWVDDSLKPWLEQQGRAVQTVRVPLVTADARTEALARYYYTIRALGLEDKLHIKTFQAVSDAAKLRKQKPKEQVDPPVDIGSLTNGNLAKPASPINPTDNNPLMDFLRVEGVDTVKFNEIAGSFAVSSHVTKAAQLAKHHAVLSSPTYVLNGRIKVTREHSGGGEFLPSHLKRVITAIRARVI